MLRVPLHCAGALQERAGEHGLSGKGLACKEWRPCGNCAAARDCVREWSRRICAQQVPITL